MRCVMTAGPTFEPLDDVRRLTNFSTGTLGTHLANTLTAAGHDVLLYRGKLATAALPVASVTVEEFSTTEDLRGRLLARATPERIALFHAAAVSDFRFGNVWKRDSSGNLALAMAGKLSTRDGTYLVELEPTPKILASLRQWYPNALLVGWKYEVEGDRDDVLFHGLRQRQECRTDLTVVNGPAWGRGFGLVDDVGVQDIDSIDGLVRALLDRITRFR